MNVQDVLEQLGYKANEARVYLAALRLGDVTVSDIAQAVHFPRSSTQIILERLHADGLMNYYVKKRYTYWSAESPKKILSNLKKKETILLSAMPNLIALRERDEEKVPAVKLFRGIKEVTSIHDDILESKQGIFIIAPWDAWKAEIGADFFHKIEQKKLNEYVTLQLLTQKCESALAYQQKSDKGSRHMRMKFLPERINITDITIMYGTKVAIISLNKKEMLGILIDDSAISNTKRIFFEELWSVSTD